MASSTSPASRGVRLQRVLADAGVAARRVCEAMIEQGRVRVNGEVVRTLPVFVDPARDRIEADGKPVVAASRHVYVMLHKPERMLVTTADEPGMDRATIMELVDHPAAARLFPVGRLDFDSSGLVLLTNDGDLAHRLTHPRYEVPKTYHVLVRGGLDEAALGAVREKMRLAGARDGDAPHGRLGLAVGAREPGRTILEVTLREARNRQLRDVLKHLGMPVKKLTRVALGPLRLTGLASGRWRELTREELRDLRAAAAQPPDRRAAPRPPKARFAESPRPRSPKKKMPRRPRRDRHA
ncbi:MAG: pseudouridine synthase [Phycisphaerae bacterium]|nr:MAG: pseudouridine synthase [Phycisphaerae bacterium]